MKSTQLQYIKIFTVTVINYKSYKIRLKLLSILWYISLHFYYLHYFLYNLFYIIHNILQKNYIIKLKILYNILYIQYVPYTRKISFWHEITEQTFGMRIIHKILTIAMWNMPRLIGKLLAFIINYQIQLQNLFFFSIYARNRDQKDC